MKTKFKYLNNEEVYGYNDNQTHLGEIAYQLKRIADILGSKKE